MLLCPTAINGNRQEPSCPGTVNWNKLPCVRWPGKNTLTLPSFIKFLFSSHIRSCTGCWCFRDVLTRKDTLNAYSVLVSLRAGCFVFKVRVRSKKDSYTKRNAQRSFYSPLTASFLISCHLFKVPYTISVLTKQNTDMFWNCFLQNTILFFKVKK